MTLVVNVYKGSGPEKFVLAGTEPLYGKMMTILAIIVGEVSLILQKMVVL